MTRSSSSRLARARSFIFDSNVRELWKAYEIFTMIVGNTWAILELIGWISVPWRILSREVVVRHRWDSPGAARPTPSLTAQQHQTSPHFISTHTPICDYIRRIRPNLMYNCPYVPKNCMRNIPVVYFDRYSKFGSYNLQWPFWWLSIIYELATGLEAPILFVWGDAITTCFFPRDIIFRRAQAVFLPLIFHRGGLRGPHPPKTPFFAFLAVFELRGTAE